MYDSPMFTSESNVTLKYMMSQQKTTKKMIRESKMIIQALISGFEYVKSAKNHSQMSFEKTENNSCAQIATRRFIIKANEPNIGVKSSSLLILSCQ